MRCFQVDATINDLLVVNPVTPGTRKDRKRKQEHWENIQTAIIQVRSQRSYM